MEKTVTGVGVLDKSVAIIDLVERAPVHAAELARELGMTVPTAYRLASALVTHSFLTRDADGRFRLGPRFSTSALIALACPTLRELRDGTGESAQLWVRRGGRRLCVANADSRAELRASIPAGALLPLPLGSAARVLLGEPEDGPGWIQSVGSRQPGVGSVSAAIRKHGEVMAAVCLSGPLDRLKPSPGELYGALVVEAAQRIEAAVQD